jgi:hypothetical protein
MKTQEWQTKAKKPERQRVIEVSASPEIESLVISRKESAQWQKLAAVAGVPQ